MPCPDCGYEPKIGEWPFNCRGRGHQLGPFWTGETAIHYSERVRVLENPATGEIRIPGRADREIHPKMQQAGFQYKELKTVSEIRAVEKQCGVRHEVSNYDSVNNLL